jgi:release factor glutamine methyltransferase
VTIADALRAAVARLTAAGVPGAAGDARALLAHALLVAPDRLTLHLPEPIPPEALQRLDAALAARAARQPVSQITGRRLFWGRSFRVTPDVLDPRPETETLVALALTWPFARMLDLGTGSGAIALSLMAERPGARAVATDLSDVALAVARHNAVALDVADRVILVRADWFEGVEGRFDLIVSNPPYIAQAEMDALSPEVRDWEPHLALSPGGDGLDAYRRISAGLRDHLMPGGRVLVEIGATQGSAVADLFRGAGLHAVDVLPDMDGRDRVVVGHAP